MIYHLETFDVTTIRAATPMYLMMRKIRAMGIKMVLSGEGADEIFGGYLYFHKAPDGRELHEETVRKLQKLHLYDCLRANKSVRGLGRRGPRAVPRPRVPRRRDEDRPAREAAAQRARTAADREVPAAHGLRRLRSPTQSSGARRSSSPTASATRGSTRSRRSPSARSPTRMMRGRGRALPGEDPGHQGSLPVSAALRAALPERHARCNCVPHETQRGVQHADGARVGCGVQAMADPSGRAVAGVHNDAYKT